MTSHKAKSPPPRWDKDHLEADRLTSIEAFRDERIKEPLEKYLEEFENTRDAFEELLETTVDLTQIRDHAIKILSDERLLEALRYLPGPPISLDDLKIVSEAPSVAARKIKADPELAARLVDTVMMGLDRRRFSWVSEDREATEKERDSAVLASAAMLASKKVETTRRHEGKNAQEQKVRTALLSIGFCEVVTRSVSTLSGAPRPGEFCMESLFGSRKADLLVGLWDERVLPIECKVSNSSTNSVKRLNNDAAVKARIWITDFGELNVVPSAVLSGVYALSNLVDAQQRGLTLFWDHNLDALTSWINGTR